MTDDDLDLDPNPTPGPWHVGAGLMVCAVDGSPVARCSSTRGKYEFEKVNARLIAAAPALLDAVKALILERENEIHNEYDGTKRLGGLLAELQPYRDLVAEVSGAAL